MNKGGCGVKWERKYCGEVRVSRCKINVAENAVIWGFVWVPIFIFLLSQEASRFDADS